MNVARSALGLKIERRSYTGHIGFDHRRLPPLFERHGFAIVKRATSPFAWGGAALATQLFFVLRKRSGPEALEFVSL
jgi:hypothetical protein